MVYPLVLSNHEPPKRNTMKKKFPTSTYNILSVLRNYEYNELDEYTHYLLQDAIFDVSRDDKPNEHDTHHVHDILSVLRDHVHTEDFKNAYRVRVRDFTRSCTFTFDRTTLLIINLMRRSLQAELNEIFKYVIPLDTAATKQAFSLARRKLLPTAFIELNNVLVKEIYKRHFKTFIGYRLVVIDGSTLQLPEGADINTTYGECSNQKGAAMNMAKISHAYDPLNGIVLSALLSRFRTCERSMAYQHTLNIPPVDGVEDLCIFDRGYPSIGLVFFLLHHNKNFLIRCPRVWLAPVNKAVASGKKDVVIEITPKTLWGENRKEFQELLPGLDLKTTAKIRVIVVELSTGEKEILVTSLIDEARFKYEIFKDLYHLRWGGEEDYKFQKVRIQIENFSGKTALVIQQDFHATILAGNIRALLAEEAQKELDDQTDLNKYKYKYKINKNISIGTLKNALIKVLLDPKSNLKAFCEGCKKEMKRSVVPIRPERQYPHKRKRNLKYPMNARRAL